MRHIFTKTNQKHHLHLLRSDVRISVEQSVITLIKYFFCIIHIILYCLGCMVVGHQTQEILITSIGFLHGVQRNIFSMFKIKHTNALSKNGNV